MNNELYHWKYISRTKGKNGKWIYVYAKNGLSKNVWLQKVKGNGYTNTSVSLYNPNGTNKGKFDVEKNIGAVKLYAGRDEETTYAGVRLDSEKFKKSVAKGKSIIDNLLKRKQVLIMACKGGKGGKKGGRKGNGGCKGK